MTSLHVLPPGVYPERDVGRWRGGGNDGKHAPTAIRRPPHGIRGRLHFRYWL